MFQRAAIVEIAGAILFVLLGIGACSPEYQEVRITVDDFRFTPTRVDVNAGQSVHLVVRNQGREPHRFQSTMFSQPRVTVVLVEGKTAAQLEQGVFLAPGQRFEALLTLSAGLYHFRCPIKGHRGMNGIIVVQEPRKAISRIRRASTPIYTVKRGKRRPCSNRVFFKEIYWPGQR